MSRPTNRQWLLAKRPDGMVGRHNFDFHEAEAPEPGPGEVLVKTLYLAFEPAMRGWMEDRESYIPPVGVGEVMRGGIVGQVVESNASERPVGSFVQCMTGWQEYAVIPAAQATPVPEGTPLTWPLGVLGITGLTAYFGMLDIGKPTEGDTVVVSGAAGATGSVAAQIARIHGCRVIGIAGGPEKCGWLTGKARLDAAIDYKSEDVAARLAELCPKGLNVYFDNVGGEILEAALDHLAIGARVVLCGGISGYNEKEPQPGPRNLMNLVIQRSRMEGLIVLDYASRFGEGVSRLAKWVADGEIAHQEDIQEGFENAPETFQRLFTGKNLGKQLLHVADPE